jgi:hypothetical protein
MENFALQASPYSFLNLHISPWGVPFPFLLCSFSLSALSSPGALSFSPHQRYLFLYLSLLFPFLSSAQAVVADGSSWRWAALEAQPGAGEPGSGGARAGGTRSGRGRSGSRRLRRARGRERRWALAQVGEQARTRAERRSSAGQVRCGYSTAQASPGAEHRWQGRAGSVGRRAGRVRARQEWRLVMRAHG